MSSAVIAPELAKSLESSGHESPLLNVFVKVRLPNSAGTADERAQAAATIVKRVEMHTKTTPKFQFRDTDSVLQVKANTDFVRELVRQPEIVEAKTVPTYSSAMIEPVRQRDVDADAINTPYAAPRRTTPRGR